MFEAFYNLSDNPFRLTPDPRFCFHHPGHDQAHAYLQYALRLGEGFIMVTGRPGIGKTTLAEVFLGELKHTEVIAARVASANAEATDLLRVVAYAYGINVEGLDKATVLVRLKQFFVDQARSRKRVLLIIDEAQSLPYPALEELRLLADLQMGSRPLLQLFLVGQERLRNLMQEPSMEQFQQRVIGACHLEPLCLADTRAYMEHRLRTADWKGDPELTGEAVLEIYRFSKGVPRHINKVCTRLLLDGFMEKKHELNRDDVLEVARALSEERLAPLGSDQAAATGTEDTESECKKGMLTVADLALRADSQPPPLSAVSVTPEAVAKVEKVTATPYTKQTAANVEQTESPGAEKAGPRMVSGRSDNIGSSHRKRSRRLPAARRVQRGQRTHPGRTQIPAWKSTPVLQSTMRKRYLVNAISRVKDRVTEWGRQLDIAGPDAWLRYYRNETEIIFENYPWIKTRSGMWIGAMAVVALAITLLLDSSEKEVGSHHSIMLEERPEISSVTPATNEIPLLTTRTDDHSKFEVASSETFEYKPVEPRLEQGADDDRLVHSYELSQRDEVVVSPLAQSAALTMFESDKGCIEPDDAEVSRGDEIAVSDVAGMPRDIPEEPAPVASTANVTVSMLQGIEDAASEIGPEESPVKQENNVVPEQAVVTVVEESSTPEPVFREDRIIELLSLAQRALRSDRLLIPSGDNAYQYYRQVLDLEPGNRSALFGMDQIVERYVSLGSSALDRKDREKAKRYIARGSRVLPGDSRLVALQERLNASGKPATEQAETQVEEQQLAAETKPKSKNLMNWLKKIFGKNHSGEQKNEVSVDDYSF